MEDMNSEKLGWNCSIFEYFSIEIDVESGD